MNPVVDRVKKKSANVGALFYYDLSVVYQGW